jgi:hypothetical protein
MREGHTQQIWGRPRASQANAHNPFLSDMPVAGSRADQVAVTGVVQEVLPSDIFPQKHIHCAHTDGGRKETVFMFIDFLRFPRMFSNSLVQIWGGSGMGRRGTLHN